MSASKVKKPRLRISRWKRKVSKSEEIEYKEKFKLIRWMKTILNIELEKRTNGYHFASLSRTI